MCIRDRGGGRGEHDIIHPSQCPQIYVLLPGQTATILDLDFQWSSYLLYSSILSKYCTHAYIGGKFGRNN